ncbi:MAG: Fur family transcriptional regulator [Alphaproteobacteria bacterium]
MARQKAETDGHGFPQPDHDHRHCIDQALGAAEALCAARGVRLTDQRRAVLRLLLEDHAPRGAYEIMDRLDWGERRPAPAQVYRALEFLQEQGLVHRLASINAFVSCWTPDRPHGAQFLICRDCGTVAEMADETVERAIVHAAGDAGFKVTAPTVEIAGICPNCAAGS